jgi:hypothetical protein
VKQGAFQTPGILPAGILAIVTVATFARLQDYGPQSTVRRFHQAIAIRDVNELQRVVREPVASAPVATLVSGVSRLLINGSPVLAGSKQTNGEERLLMTYRDDLGNAFPIVFFVERNRTDRNWKINASKTSVAFENYLRALYGPF